ncbi:MAG: alpha/beta hydrolase-fold protein [Bacteroidota bacterium]
MGGNNKIPKHIIVGIPHIDWKEKRGIDLTFSHTRIEYDGDPIDSTVYTDQNSGGAELFYQFLNHELVAAVNKNYSTNGKNILVGHSYGGYFCSYILARDHQFSAFQIYDPSIWYSEGEAIKQITANLSKDKQLHVFISYQPIPPYHAHQIEFLIHTLQQFENITLTHQLYEKETHNSLFLPSFLDGIKQLYKDWKKD